MHLRIKKVLCGLAVFSMLLVSLPLSVSADTKDYQVEKTLENTVETVSFKAYKNNAKLEIAGANLANAKLTLNGQPLAVTAAGTIDISASIKNGSNELKIEAVEPVTVRIPFGTVTKELDTQNEWFTLLDGLINAETLYGLSAAQLAVIKDGTMVKSTGYGYNTAYASKLDANGKIILNDINVIPVADRVAVTEDTLFDLASNTKMYATVYSVQKLVSEGLLDVEQPIYEIFPEFLNIPENFKDSINTVENRKKVKVSNLLHHDAGFLPDPQYHNENSKINDPSLNYNPLFTQDRDEALGMMLKTKLTTEPGIKNVYSDTDFMLLGAVVEAKTGQRLDQYVRENFTQPLDVNSVTFNPLQNGFSKDQITASEVHGNTRDGRYNFSNVRHNVVQGEVHDEKAFYTMNGISGHAGLFGNAHDIATMAQVMLNNGGMGDNGFFSPEVIDQFTTPYGSQGTQDTYALGWRRTGESGKYKWAFSNYSSAETVGHTGWTGTVTVIDPVNNVVIALMTNARNTPIMTRSSDAFYTANFNTNSYGPVTDTVYQALGLGTNETPMNHLKGLVLGEISNVSKDSTASKRNAVRALFHVLDSYTETSAEALDLWNSDAVQNVLPLLKETYEADTKYLDQTVLDDFTRPATIDASLLETLEAKHESMKSVTSEKYTEASFNGFSEIVTNVGKMIEEIKANPLTHSYTDNDLKAAIESLDNAFASLILIDGTGPIDPVDPVDPVKPVDPTTPEKDKESTLPSTGIAANTALYVIAGALVLGGLVLKKKEN